MGDKILIEHLDFQVGGGGTNSAVSFKRQGFKTAYLGKIGEDLNGVRVYSYLKKEGVDFIGSLGKENGFSVILDSVADDRTILNYKGCSNDLHYSEINKSLLSTKWFYFSSMLEESFKTMKKLAFYASKNNIKIAFNPSIYQASQGINVLKSILDKTDLLIFNKEESQALSGEEDVKKVLKRLKKYVKGFIVITDGKRGALLYDGKHVYEGKPSPDIKVVETTGAGDAFASALTGAFIDGDSVTKAMKKGFIQAEAVIQSYGAKSNLLSKSELLKKVRLDKRKITKKKI